MQEKFDLILFDLDGTLTNSGEGVTKSVQYALAKFGIDEPDLKKLEKFIGPPLIDSFMEYYGFTQEEAIQVRKVFNERYEPVGWKENYPYPGISGVLERLRDAGKILGVATSKPADKADNVLGLFDLKKYFQVISAAPLNGLNSDKVDRIKSCIAQARQMGCPAERPVLVGDTKYDVIGAHMCGIPCVGVAWGFAAEGELEAHHAEYLVETMEELTELLLRQE